MARRTLATVASRCTETPPWEWRLVHAGVSRISRRHPSSARPCSFWPRFADRVRPLCESLGVSRVTRIIRVRRRMILEEENAAQTSDEMALSLDWLMPGFTEHSQEQATPSAGQSGTRCTRSVDVACPARSRMREIIRDTCSAALVGDESTLEPTWQEG